MNNLLLVSAFGPDERRLENDLPPTKVKRKYECKAPQCHFITVNPRLFLRHRSQEHGEKVRIVECPHCIYACQYRQKLNRHLRLIHNIISNNNRSSLGNPTVNNPSSSDNYNINLVDTTVKGLDTQVDCYEPSNELLDVSQDQQLLQPHHAPVIQQLPAHQQQYFTPPMMSGEDVIKCIIGGIQYFNHPFYFPDPLAISNEPLDLSLKRTRS